MGAKKRIIAAIMLMATIFAALAATPKWEEVNVAPTELQSSFNEQDAIQIMVADGYIYVVSQQPVNIKIFSILGQLISQETIPGGTHRLKMNARGIYILKAGSMTRRITI